MIKNIKTPERIITTDNIDVSVLTGLDSSLTSVLPDQEHIYWKKKSKGTPSVSILRNYPIRETVTTGKISQGDSLMHPKNEIQHKISQLFQHRVYYEVDTN